MRPSGQSFRKIRWPFGRKLRQPGGSGNPFEQEPSPRHLDSRKYFIVS